MTRAPRLAAVSILFLGLATNANANLIRFTADLNGPNESPPNASPGTGFAVIDFDTIANTMHVQANFSGLLGPTTASHIHCCTAVAGAGTAGVATTTPFFTGFPIGVTSGTYNHVFDMTLASSYNPAFVTSHGGTVPLAEAALLAGMDAGKSYFNIHSTFRPGGEIRGFLQPVPEPASIAMFGLGVAAFGFLRRKRTI